MKKINKKSGEKLDKISLNDIHPNATCNPKKGTKVLIGDKIIYTY